MRAQKPGESALLLLDAVEVLERQDIPYAVVGAMAAAIHGVVRASVDADAVLSLAMHRLGEVERQFRSAGFQTELRYGDPDDPIGAVLALADAFGNRVDLLAGLRGLESAAFSRALDVEFRGRSLRVVGLEDFVAMKLFAGGPQDISDAEQALSSARDSVDLSLVERLATRYGQETREALRRLFPGSRS